MRVAFAGTPPFAARILEAILAAGHVVPIVLTQPDRPAGRGLKLTPSAVSIVAGVHGLSLDKPASLKSEEAQRPLLESHPDVLVVAAYGLLLPKAVLDIPRKGCLNVHASLLPRWRGAAPIQRAILAGDRETGVGIMVMEPGLDTGPVVLERRVEIGDQDTAASLTERLADEGATAIVEALANLEHLVPKKQSHDGVTYAAKIDKSEAQLDWNQPAIEVWRKVRAYNPVPGASTLLLEQPFKVWEARLVANCHGDPGTVVGEFEGSPVVACSTGGLALTYVQSPGSRRMSGADFLKGHPLPEGARFGA